MSSCSARVEVRAGALARAVCDAVAADGGARVSVSEGGDAVVIDVAPQQLPHARAALNSTLRLVQASIESIGASRSA